MEIFGCSENVPFAGITVIAVGDFCQLPPVQQRTVYAEYRDAWQNLVHLWKLFKLAELCEVMRQRGDSNLIDLLNKVRTASLEENDEIILRSRIYHRMMTAILLMLFTFLQRISLVKSITAPCLNSNGNFVCTIPAIDVLPKNVSRDVIEKVLNRNQSETGGLARILEIKINARVMLTVNIDMADRLINGQIGNS